MTLGSGKVNKKGIVCCSISVTSKTVQPQSVFKKNYNLNLQIKTLCFNKSIYTHRTDHISVLNIYICLHMNV